jgi:hypothetical protein
MKITADTATKLTVYCPRMIGGDVVALIFFGMGSLLTVGAINSEPSWEIQLMFAFAVVFAGIGILIALNHSSTRATLDATTQTLTLDWRPLKGRRVKAIPFADIRRIALYDDECQTVKIILTDKTEVLMENGYSSNSRAAPMALRMDEWLRAHRTSTT